MGMPAQNKAYLVPQATGKKLKVITVLNDSICKTLLSQAAVALQYSIHAMSAASALVWEKNKITNSY